MCYCNSLIHIVSCFCYILPSVVYVRLHYFVDVVVPCMHALQCFFVNFHVISAAVFLFHYSFVLLHLSQGSLGKSISTSMWYVVGVRFAYTLSSQDPSLWNFIVYVVVVLKYFSPMKLLMEQ